MGVKMKISEFKKAIESIGFCNGKDLKVTENDREFYIQNGNIVLAIIDKTANCLIDTCYQDFFELEERLRQTLFDTICEFASTPPEEREDER